ncbi:DUF1754 family protein [Tieghemostelium lacteum]|uniref:DUF1754 family protein n=1 Tax=Tieghemostelium lacteum TaxID=361077 RepID=A0A152A4R1_TIELA|nr:DUF1754 family protein [Tieghemostelium lacteum]|eukprot:KYR01219.1 DUF1754 family protein [Tieghemostelium lacteum]
MSSYSNTIGGKLKLKGSSVPLTPNHSNKKKKKPIIKKIQQEPVEEEEFNPRIEVRDSHLTDAQRKHKEKQLRKEAERISKIIGKSHKEKIEDYNKYLSSLSEHHDIPKVGPG